MASMIARKPLTFFILFVATDAPPEPPDTGVGVSSGLTESEMWGIIGGIIALVLLTGIVVLICCVCRLCCC